MHTYLSLVLVTIVAMCLLSIKSCQSSEQEKAAQTLLTLKDDCRSMLFLSIIEKNFGEKLLPFIGSHVKQLIELSAQTRVIGYCGGRSNIASQLLNSKDSDVYLLLHLAELERIRVNSLDEDLVLGRLQNFTSACQFVLFRTLAFRDLLSIHESLLSVVNEKTSLPAFIHVSYVHEPYLPHEVIVKCKREQDLPSDLLDKKVKYPGIELVIKFLEIKGRHYTLEMERAQEQRSIRIVASMESPKAFAKPEIVSEQVEPSEQANQSSSEKERQSVSPAESSVNPLTKTESKNDLFIKVLPEKGKSSEFSHEYPPAHMVKFLGRDIYTVILFFMAVCSMATTLRCCKQKKDLEQLNEKLKENNKKLQKKQQATTGQNQQATTGQQQATTRRNQQAKCRE
jgi:hypothetical protein